MYMPVPDPCEHLQDLLDPTNQNTTNQNIQQHLHRLHQMLDGAHGLTNILVHKETRAKSEDVMVEAELPLNDSSQQYPSC